jgi:polyhydroxyalkanoate synthesis regulator phasin
MPAPRSSSSARSASARTKSSSARTKSSQVTKQPVGSAGTNGMASLIEALTNRVIKPLDLVMISRERIQDTLDEAAERGRLTRSDANELVSELVRLGREQTDNVLADIERLLLGRSRTQTGATTKLSRLPEPVERLVRGAGRVRRTVSGNQALPIIAYDDLTARQATERLKDLMPAELRQVRDYERRHANRKSVLAAIERALK